MANLFPYVIQRAASNGLKIIDNNGGSRLFPSPYVSLDTSSGIPTIEFVSGNVDTSIPVSQISTVNGVSQIGNTGVQVLAAIQGSLANAIVVASSGFDSVQTAAVGANFTPLNGQNCSKVIIYNQSGTGLDISQSNGLAFISLASGANLSLGSLMTAGDVLVRRTDKTNVQVAVAYRYES